MYNEQEAKKEQIKAERKSIIVFFALLAVIGVLLALTASKLSDNKAYYAIYIVAAFFAVKLSRVYCFLLPRRRYGTVVSLSGFEEKTSIINPKTYSGRTGQYTKTVFTLAVKLKNGKTKFYEFEFTEGTKKLKVGDAVGIYRFLKSPVSV